MARAIFSLLSRPTPPADPPAEGLDAAAAAAFVGVSVSKWRAMDADGHVPASASLGDGRCPRWSATELRAWLLSGTPARPAWVPVRDQAIRRYRPNP